MSAVYLAFQYRLKPTKAQHDALRRAMERTRQLYNAALEERIDCYRKTGRSRFYFDQTAALAQLRQADGTPYAWSMEAAPLKAVDLAYREFFRRGGFPRFKGRNWFKWIGWVNRTGWKFRNGRFIAKGIGAIRTQTGRSLPSPAKTARISRKGRHWYLTLTCEVQCAPTNEKPAIGLDLGISTLAARSDGVLIANDRPSARATKEMRRTQRALARCKRGSRRRKKVRARLARLHERIRQRRETYLHQVSANLVRHHGLIAVEKLNVRGLASGMLAREVLDASWGRLKALLSYKAKLNGGRVVEVDARGTSQTCPECGQMRAKSLQERLHQCDCGCVMDRDVAAAKVVLLRALQSPEELNVSGYAERAPRKAAA